MVYGNFVHYRSFYETVIIYNFVVSSFVKCNPEVQYEDKRMTNCNRELKMHEMQVSSHGERETVLRLFS